MAAHRETPDEEERAGADRTDARPSSEGPGSPGSPGNPGNPGRSGNTGSSGSAAGGISIGLLTGGVVASGEGASAEDRSLRIGTPAPLPASVEGLAAPAPVPGGIGIGAMTGGVVASGKGAKAVSASTRMIDASPDLYATISALREQLTVLAPTDEVATVDAQLAAAEEEISETRQVSGDRLRWLRERLSLGATAAAGLASAATVVQAIDQLVG